MTKLFLTILSCFCFSSIIFSQIIADHTVVEKYDDIPQYYIDIVKKMWLATPGESHGYAYRTGLTLLETIDSRFQVNVSGTPPEGYTESYLRSNGTTWGDLTTPSGWIHYYGEEDWFTSLAAIERTKAGITYCNTHNYQISAIGFAWCYDPAVLNATAYLAATQEYINHCAANGYSTKVFFTTGPVDADNAGGELGYKKYLLYEEIRNYVKADQERILFDFADILCYDDNGNKMTTTWGGNTYPIITPTNLGQGLVWHMSNAGALRLGKAQWWMLARIAGWDGVSTEVEENRNNMNKSIKKIVTTDEIKLFLDENLITWKAELLDYQGRIISDKPSRSYCLTFNSSFLPMGIYFIVLSNSTKRIVEKVVKP